MAMGGLSKLANLSITLQRRWSNVLSDQQRQHVVEMFLGLRTDAYFPSARLLYSPDVPLEARRSAFPHSSYLAVETNHIAAFRRRASLGAAFSWARLLNCNGPSSASKSASKTHTTHP